MNGSKPKSAVFLDTTILEARNFKSVKQKRKIAKRLKTFDFRATSAVARQEFKRRVVGDAIYLYEQLSTLKNIRQLLQKVSNLPALQNRKLKICLDVFATTALDPAPSEEEQTERCLLQLKSFIDTWRDQIDSSVDHVIELAGCSASESDVVALKSGYKRPSKHCTDFPGCGIGTFLASPDCQRNVVKIDTQLKGITGAKSDEIQTTGEFIAAIRSSPDDVRNADPCLTVGDFLISLESSKIPTFYTMNFKESQHFCRALDQNLIVVPSNDENVEVEFNSSDKVPWKMPNASKEPKS